MIDTQCALNLGFPSMIELEPWMRDRAATAENGPQIDPLFGCSVRLPKLMVRDSRTQASAFS